MSFDYPAFLDAWIRAMDARDLDTAMRGCHPDIRLAMHFGDLPLPFIGVTTGIEACRRRTQKMWDTWIFQVRDYEIVAIEGDEVRCNMAITIQHRWTGYSIDTKNRQRYRFEDGLIRSFDGYTDVPRFSAFMKYVGIAPSR